MHACTYECVYVCGCVIVRVCIWGDLRGQQREPVLSFHFYMGLRGVELRLVVSLQRKRFDSQA